MSAVKRKRGGKGTGPKKAKKGKFVENGEQRENLATQQEQATIISVPRPVSQGKWKNKERVLIFSSRGINFRTRHLMQDLRTMMPHAKADTKMDRKDKLFVVNEVCEIKNCNKCLFFEAKKKKDLYMWVSNTPHGPSAKFLVQNVHTLAELKMTGNCLKGSRPLLSFDPKFDAEPQYALLKELFIQIFSTPQYHPKSQPFVDHVFTFTIMDNRIWFRNYQIIEEDASLVEIGPRFVLNLIKIFQGSFGGPTLYENPHFQSPNTYRRMVRQAMASKQKEKQLVKEIRLEKRKEVKELPTADVTEDVFVTPAEEKPVEVELEAPAPERKKKLKLTELKRRTWLKRKGLR
ncbi:ribosome biogenesis protein BRX1 homolog [Electrophorus electricus]|uniref:Ribosome biogenesis protein BRX1 homolog n=1 Tax=Electrophorus electricus TaxID=8005 RepID=A0AAY5EUZ5_ELEEL|nr:ribosome biogenesis protein BRX1 homolog [Electrophorus electricus]